MNSSTQLMTLIDIRLRMLKCMSAGDTRLFRDRARVGYGVENVWRYKAADGILLDFLHDRG
jgi:hypothetical protein